MKVFFFRVEFHLICLHSMTKRPWFMSQEMTEICLKTKIECFQPNSDTDTVPPDIQQPPKSHSSFVQLEFIIGKGPWTWTCALWRVSAFFSASLINFSEAFKSVVCQRRVSWIFITSTFVRAEVSISLWLDWTGQRRIQFTCICALHWWKEKRLKMGEIMCAEKSQSSLIERAILGRVDYDVMQLLSHDKYFTSFQWIFLSLHLNRPSFFFWLQRLFVDYQQQFEAHF